MLGNRSLGLRAVAAFEAAKGLAVLLAGFGLLRLVHRDIQAAAERFVHHLHLDPASHYPRIFLRVATRATPGALRLLALGALVYAVVRFVEAVGLWHARRWAEWLGVITAAVYVPVELIALFRRPGWGVLAALAVNLVIVLFLGLDLRAGSKQHPASTDSAALP